MTANRIHSSNKKTHIKLKIVGLVIPIIAILLLQISSRISFTIENSLWGHMIVEHSIFFFMGYSMAALLNKQNIVSIYYQVKRHILSQKHLSYSKKDLEKKDTIRHRTRYLWFLTGVFLMILWHIPFVFDIALYDDLVHLLQHISFIFIGVCIYKIIKSFDFSILIIFFILCGGVMGIMGLALILTKNAIYSFYTIQSHIDAGNYMIVTGIIMMFVILPLVIIKKALQYI